MRLDQPDGQRQAEADRPVEDGGPAAGRQHLAQRPPARPAAGHHDEHDGHDGDQVRGHEAGQQRARTADADRRDVVAQHRVEDEDRDDGLYGGQRQLERQLDDPAPGDEQHDEDADHAGDDEGGRLDVYEADGEGHFGEREAIDLGLAAFDPQCQSLTESERRGEQVRRDIERYVG
jgi:hypothetical protein